MERKDFLRVAGMAWGTGMLASCASEGGAPAEGGAAGETTRDALESAAGPDLGLQLYTVRSLMAEDVAGNAGCRCCHRVQRGRVRRYFGHGAAHS